MGKQNKSTIVVITLEDQVKRIAERLDLQTRGPVTMGKRIWGLERELDMVITRSHYSTNQLGIEVMGNISPRSVIAHALDVKSWPIPGIIVISNDFEPNYRSYFASTGKVVEIEDLEKWLRVYFNAVPEVT